MGCHNTLTPQTTPRLGPCHSTLTPATTPRLGLSHSTLTARLGLCYTSHWHQQQHQGLGYVTQHTDTSNSKAWAMSQFTDISKNTKAWAMSQHTNSSKNTKPAIFPWISSFPHSYPLHFSSVFFFVVSLSSPWLVVHDEDVFFCRNS